LSWLGLQSWLHVSLYRLTGGRVGGSVFGAPVLLLSTVGRRTGKKRTTPLLYIEDRDNLVVVASNGGREKNPGWFTNIKQDPLTEVQIRGRRTVMRAEQAGLGERERLWPLLTNMYGRYDEYQAKAKREIPVVILHRDDRFTAHES
jgi:deazaflavin-dependent oxidoreductase (nitroreductase family)